MPEGPEVYCATAQLKATLEGKIITRLKWSTDPGKIPEAVGKGLKLPVQVTKVYPRGKRIIFQLGEVNSAAGPKGRRDGSERREGEKEGYLVTFLGMTGRWLHRKPISKKDGLVGGHVHCTLYYKRLSKRKERKLYYDDARKIGRLFYFPSQKQLDTYLGRFGVDLLSDIPSRQEWRQLCARPKATTTVYSFLLNPHYNSTVGNYLASEILYFACLHPLRPMGDLTRSEIDHLRKCAIQTCRYAHSQGGLTISDYLTPDGKKGGYKRSCYGREKKGDPEGRPVKRGVLGGRSYFYVPELL